MDTQTLSEILNRLDKIEDRLKKLEDSGETHVTKEKKNLSIREFFLLKNPTDEIQKTLAVCFYLENYGDLEYFNIKDIENGFRSAKEKLPKNINYNVFMNIKKGYMMEHNEKKENLKGWVLTNSGNAIVELNFKEKS